jgi:hypothetical protein
VNTKISIKIRYFLKNSGKLRDLAWKKLVAGRLLGHMGKNIQ